MTRVSAYWRDCEHLTLSDEDDCPVCEDNKAARVEGMEAVRQLFIKAAQSKPKKNTIYISIPMELVGEIDKLIEATR